MRIKATIGLLLTLGLNFSVPSESALPQNCDDIRLQGELVSGVYRIYPLSTHLSTDGVQVYCDLSNDEGWIVIQRREPPPSEFVDFERTWVEYQAGFGNATGSHWLGLDIISELTKLGNMQLRVDMTDWDDDERYAQYDYFKVSSAADNYRLHVDDFSGNAGDSLIGMHSGVMFSTKDHDNDNVVHASCAVMYRGAWWYNNCHTSNLNGLDLGGDHETYAIGVNWFSWRGYHYSLKTTEMKIRNRHSCEPPTTTTEATTTTTTVEPTITTTEPTTTTPEPTTVTEAPTTTTPLPTDPPITTPVPTTTTEPPTTTTPFPTDPPITNPPTTTTTRTPPNLCPIDDPMPPPHDKCPPFEPFPTYLPYPYDCRKYFQCSNGAAVCHICSNGTVWDQSMEVCNFESEVGCIIVTTSPPFTSQENSVISFFKKLIHF